ASIARRRDDVEQVIRRLTGRQEWGVRIGCDAARALMRARRRARSDTGAVTPGTRFLLGKRRQQDLERSLAGEIRLQVERAFRDLARQAADARRRTATEHEVGSRIVLDAAFLVPVKRAARFRSEVRRWEGSLTRLGCEVALTGPWAPYHFVTERSEAEAGT
ncbi:MAG: GvpL/GvpF family gas vesicle protein, partial [Candidatus Rokuibacteriota bacterium]